jgi:hypothetical protein
MSMGCGGAAACGGLEGISPMAIVAIRWVKGSDDEVIGRNDI